MRLQKNLAYRYKTKDGQVVEHYKYVINLPEEVVEELGLKEGDELQHEVKEDRLILKPVKRRNKVKKYGKG